MVGLAPGELSLSDPVNAAILSVSEDQLQGFRPDPIGEIARLSGLPAETVIERIAGLLRAGVIRRVRQTLIATNLAEGALIAWRLPEEKLESAFDFLLKEDPFSGHVVIRNAEPGAPGDAFRLWTTLKVPKGYSIERHAAFLADRTGAADYRLMPAKAVFALGVGHTRRREIEPGARTDEPAQVSYPEEAELSDLEWRVLVAIKREFAPEEIARDIWRPRAKAAGLDLDEFCAVAQGLAERRVLGRFSTFLEHAKPTAAGERVTKHNALFHWAVPPGRELDAGSEIGRHLVLTHCYWRETGPEFANVSIMGVVHGLEKERVLAHKAAIDRHVEEAGIPLLYTNVFWGGRSEIKPSEIDPAVYVEWCAGMAIDPLRMRA